MGLNLSKIGISRLIFGYRVITPEDGGMPRLATRLLSQGISSTSIDGGFIIGESDYAAFKSYASGRFRYTASEVMGLRALARRLRRHISSLITLAITLAVVWLLSGVVWDVRVSADEPIEEDRVISTLESLGFRVGSTWRGFDKEEVEARLLSSLSDISWVSINRVGTVATVEVKVNHSAEVETDPTLPLSNIVALEDGVIEEIIVYEGTAMVRRGDVVRKGDILISGIIETEGGTILTEADGRVLARTLEVIELDVKRESPSVEYVTGETHSIVLTILGFNINIFKNYGNLEDQYGIIEEKWQAHIPSGHKFPLSVTTSYALRPHISYEIYTDAELPSVASSRLYDLIKSRGDEVELVGITTEGEYTHDGYKLHTECVFIKEIGQSRQIEFENGG